MINKFALLFIIIGIAFPATNLISSHSVGAQETIQVVPASSDALLSAAKEQYQKGNYQQAVDLSTQAIKANANNINAFYYRGIARLEIEIKKPSFTPGSLTSIDTDLTRVIELDPSNYEVYFYHGLAHYKQFSSPSEFSLLVSVNQDMNIQLRYHYRENLDKAESSFKKYIEINPKGRKEAYLYLIDLLIIPYSSADGVRPYLDKLIGDKGDKNDSNLYLLEGLYYTNNSQSLQVNKQIESFNKSIIINSNNVYAYYYRGNAYASLKNAQSAIDDYTKAIQIAPKFAKAYEQRSKIYESIGDNESATRDKHKADTLSQS